MRDTLIRWLGGYTDDDIDFEREFTDKAYNRIEELETTIRELQALIPVSAVTPKKRGRPRKASRVTYISKPNVLSGPNE